MLKSLLLKEKMLENLLLNNDFLLDKKNISLINNNAIFLIASLKKDVESTFKVLNEFNYSESIYMEDNQAYDLIKFLIIDKQINFIKLPGLIKNAIVDYISNNFYDEKDFIVSLVKEGYVPITYVSSHALMFLSELRDLYKNNEEVYKYIDSNYLGYDSDRFCEEEEKKLLRIMGYKYKECEKIEDIFVIMKKSKLKRDNMSMVELLALQLYAAKELSKNGISKRINVLSYSRDKGTLGMQQGDEILLYIHGYKNDIVNMTLTLVHEIEHAIQFKNIDSGNIIEDNDVDLYTKDVILRLLMGENYYNENYTYMSYEYDASFKSNIKVAKLFGLIDIDYVNKDLYVFDENAEKALSYAKKENEYDMNMQRNITYDINSLFEREMKELKENDLGRYASIFFSCPIIKYEYHYDEFRRKTIEELVDELDSCKTKKDMGIYFNLLKNRLNSDKEDVCVCNNIEEIKRLYASNKYSDTTKKILENIFRVVAKENKYKGYFYKNKGNKR